MFVENFIKSLPDNDIDAIVKVCDVINATDPVDIDYDDYIEAYAILSTLCERANLDLTKVSLSGLDNDIPNLRTFIGSAYGGAKSIQVQETLDIEEGKFKSIREDIYEYEFSDSDYKKIQVQINRIRNLISESKVISEDHQNRLLKRLEQFQGELHKRVTNLDRALGFLLDVSIIVKQTGEGAKPIAVVAKEISKIITQVILVSKGLPPGELPLLLK